MAEVTAHQHKYLIKDLDTTSVTLSPHTTTVVRQVNDVPIENGRNEITLYGLTPTTEDHSLQINGQGAALITDMTVECVLNDDKVDNFDFMDSDDSEEDASSSEDEEDEENEEIKAADAAIVSLKQEHAGVKEKMQSIMVRMGFLETYGKSLHGKDTSADNVVEYLTVYSRERDEMYEAHRSFEERSGKLDKEIHRKNHERNKLEEKRDKVTAKARKEKLKLAKKKAQAREAKQAEKRRRREQVMEFWPKKVYKVVLTLETSSDEGASSSRPQSRDMALKKQEPDRATRSDQPPPLSLSFSYVTQSAFWGPVYNVQIFTPTRSGTIAYRAEFENATSETWRNTKLMLSTSQTSISGLGDAIPVMAPWHVRLSKRRDSMSHVAAGSAKAWEGGWRVSWKRRPTSDTWPP